MKLLQVNYERELPQDDTDQAERLARAAGHIAALPGLIWKVWIHDDMGQRAGGLYLFDTEEHARAWGEGPMVSSLSLLPGVGAVTAHYFDVAEDLSAVTGASGLLAARPQNRPHETSR